MITFIYFLLFIVIIINNFILKGTQSTSCLGLPAWLRVIVSPLRRSNCCWKRSDVRGAACPVEAENSFSHPQSRTRVLFFIEFPRIRV